MIKAVKPVNLPQNPGSEYERRLSIMLYEHLRQLTDTVNSLVAASNIEAAETSSDAQHILANQVFGR